MASKWTENVSSSTTNVAELRRRGCRVGSAEARETRGKRANRRPPSKRGNWLLEAVEDTEEKFEIGREVEAGTEDRTRTAMEEVMIGIDVMEDSEIAEEVADMEEGMLFLLEISKKNIKQKRRPYSLIEKKALEHLKEFFSSRFFEKKLIMIFCYFESVFFSRK